MSIGKLRFPPVSGDNRELLTSGSAVHNLIATLQPGVGGKAGWITSEIATAAHSDVELAGDAPSGQQALGNQHLNQTAGLPGSVAGGDGDKLTDAGGPMELCRCELWRLNGIAMVL